MPSIRLVALVASATLVLTAGCSKSDGASVLGHWRAERVQMYSVQLPLGPDVVISKEAITNPGTGARIPLDNIERKDDTAVLDTAYGMGITLYFASADRVYLKVPFIGRVYYRRLREPAVAADSASNAVIRPADRPTLSASAVVPRPVEAAGSTDGSTAGPVNGAPQAHPAEGVLVAATAPHVSTDAAGDLMSQGEAALHAGAIHQAEVILTQAEAFSSTHPVVDYDLAVLAAKRSDADGAIDHLNRAFKLGYRQFAVLDATREFDGLRQDVRYQALVARYR